jgi:hypothetical protein
MTDSMHIRQQAVERWGRKIITSLSATLEHSSKESSVSTGNVHAGVAFMCMNKASKYSSYQLIVRNGLSANTFWKL